MHTVWIVVVILVAAGLWWIFVMREAPKEMAQSDDGSTQSGSPSTAARSNKVNTQSAGTLQALSVLTLICWPILWFAAAGEQSWMLFFAGCAAFSQGVFLWGFSNIIENLAHIRHNTTTL
jgi:hypothetical protein